MWTTEELEKIAAADELQISALRRDGTLSKSVTIWVVRHGDDLYVRSAYGRGSAWFRAAEERHEGHISAGGVEKIVRFVAGADYQARAERRLARAYSGIIFCRAD
jgi:hypothetical protein